MPNTKAGTWSGEAPTINGIYWWRADERDYEPEIHEIADGLVFRIESRRSEPVENYGGEWLGPVTSADFEQLNALRRAGRIALAQLERSWRDIETQPNPVYYDWTGIVLLRAALEPNSP